MFGVLTVALVAAVTGLGSGPLLRRLPEPDQPDGKPRYADLPTRAFVGICVGLAAAGTALAQGHLSRAALPLWWVLSSLGVLLAVVDAVTTWLPTRLIRLAWALMTLAALVGFGWSGNGWVLVRAAIGALVAGAIYLVAYAISRGSFGFGDVRFAPVIGAAASAESAALFTLTLLLGTFLGAGHGLVRLARRRPGPFPYAPSMLAGAYLACVIAA